MGTGFQFIDIILFAMIAAFLILRLRGVLGRRDGHEGGYHDQLKTDSSEERRDDNVIQLTETGAEKATEQDEGAWDTEKPETKITEKEAALEKLQAADNEFNEEDFLVGARVAFEMILGAYAAGDLEVLQNLLSEDVYKNFHVAISEREEAGHVMEETLVGIRSAEIVEVSMDGSEALVTTKFLSEQVHVVRDKEGLVIDGNPNQVTDVIDFWTFARDISSHDPNWQLVATQSLD